MTPEPRFLGGDLTTWILVLIACVAAAVASDIFPDWAAPICWFAGWNAAGFFHWKARS